MSTGGKEFVGPFRLFHMIRVGATYEIWAVQPVGKKEPLAMKWLPPGEKHTRQASNDLKHEYNVGKGLVHDSIIKTCDRQAAGQTAPAQGLLLVEVDFS